MLDYTIRKMNKDDIDTVVNLIANTYDHEGIWKNYRQDQIYPEIAYTFNSADTTRPDYVVPEFFVAEKDGEIIAVSAVQRSIMSDAAFELSWGTTKPEYQRQEIMTALTLKRIESAKSKIEHGYIFVSTRFPHLFLKLGFIKIIDRDDADAIGSAFCYLKF